MMIITMMRSFLVVLLCWSLMFSITVTSFVVPSPDTKHGVSQCTTPSSRTTSTSTALAAQVSQQEAQAGIDKVVAALRKDATAKAELGQLEKVTIVLGYGSPTPGSLAVRFNAAFRRGGMGLSAVPLPFGLGQSNVPEGRGTMVGQVKASVDIKSGKVTSCSVFRDLGYGRAFNLKV